MKNRKEDPKTPFEKLFQMAVEIPEGSVELIPDKTASPLTEWVTRAQTGTLPETLQVSEAENELQGKGYLGAAIIAAHWWVDLQATKLIRTAQEETMEKSGKVRQNDIDSYVSRLENFIPETLSWQVEYPEKFGLDSAHTILGYDLLRHLGSLHKDADLHPDTYTAFVDEVCTHIHAEDEPFLIGRRYVASLMALTGGGFDNFRRFGKRKKTPGKREATEVVNFLTKFNLETFRAYADTQHLAHKAAVTWLETLNHVDLSGLMEDSFSENLIKIMANHVAQDAFDMSLFAYNSSNQTPSPLAIEVVSSLSEIWFRDHSFLTPTQIDEYLVDVQGIGVSSDFFASQVTKFALTNPEAKTWEMRFTNESLDEDGGDSTFSIAKGSSRLVMRYIPLRKDLIEWHISFDIDEERKSLLLFLQSGESADREAVVFAAGGRVRDQEIVERVSELASMMITTDVGYQKELKKENETVKVPFPLPEIDRTRTPSFGLPAVGAIKYGTAVGTVTEEVKCLLQTEGIAYGKLKKFMKSLDLVDVQAQGCDSEGNAYYEVQIPGFSVWVTIVVSQDVSGVEGQLQGVSFESRFSQEDED